MKSKLSIEKRMDLLFDLVNSFGKLNGPEESALFLQDLLTENEVENLSKRLRIAKLILSGKSQREISLEMKTSPVTVHKVSSWLDSGGGGFKKVLKSLPKRASKPKAGSGRAIEFQGPQFLLKLYQYSVHQAQTSKLEKIGSTLRLKSAMNRDIQESYSDFYKKRSKGRYRPQK